ncbi:hypothetical protein AMATHDRAFT_146368 [Amanita thiersii Skay4041]|uniref:Cytochrome P450 n=1 Tax=Amanita thiersii Skay4041 TaxID=703135 RepID=A0A2A9NP22_9AGAR|nr:hypothetical protein AMATHDRAFT_146368 [Amanita thiersii Skay4041]
MDQGVFAILLSLLVLAITYAVLILPRSNPLLQVAGPPVNGWFGNHLKGLLEPSISPRTHGTYVARYGKTIRIRGVGFWDERLLTLDPVSVSYILKNPTIYEKPWQSRRLITGLIGCGVLAAEGEVHKRQRRIVAPAFSSHNLKVLVPLAFRKGSELRDKWLYLIKQQQSHMSPSNCQEGTIDVYYWISRATFDVIGVAGFDYDFHAIQTDSNELFSAYKTMFDAALSQNSLIRTVLGVYFPWLSELFPDRITQTIRKCQGVIHRVASRLISEKKRKVLQSRDSGASYAGKDLLSLLLQSNLSSDLPPEQRISDGDILNNINTFMFAGSDTSSLTLTWTLYLLAQHPSVQDRLRHEFISSIPQNYLPDFGDEEFESLYDIVSNLPYLHNVVREAIRLIPPVHSSLRVATCDDEIPTAYPVHQRDGSISTKKSVAITRGTLIHVAIEGFNLDKSIWGEDAWEYNPDRWDNLPEPVSSLPGLFSNTLTFSAGPRSCIGMRFSVIEIKVFLYILVTDFVFKLTENKISKVNVVLTRPYVIGKYKEGSKCPLIVEPYTS